MTIGKYILVWRFSQLEAGRKPEAMIEEAVGLGLGMVAIKIADGAAVNDGSGSDEKIRFYVDHLHARGLQVWGWQYLYGGRRLVRKDGKVIGSAENTYSTPEKEAKVAIARVKQFGFDGYIMDPEAEYKTAPAGRAARFMSLVHAGLGQTPIALCSYRFPKVHPELPWGEFLPYTDCHMPQVYWQPGPRGTGYGADGRLQAVIELEKSIQQLRELRDLPVLPAGRAYISDGHPNPRNYEIAGFLERCVSLKLEGAGFWNWDSLRPAYPGAAERAQAIACFHWPGEEPKSNHLFMPFVAGGTDDV